jgi:hypothetical protein
VLIVGADRAPRGLDTLAERLGLPVEWIEGSTRTVNQAERRIRGGTVAGLIVLDGYMPHRMFDALLAASRATGVPFAYGGRGGKGALATAAEALATALAARRVA